MKVIILDNETNKKDELLKNLIGTVWTVKETEYGSVIIDTCGGIKLEKEDYEII